MRINPAPCLAVRPALPLSSPPHLREYASSFFTAYMHACVHTSYIHATCMHAYIHTCMQTYICSPDNESLCNFDSSCLTFLAWVNRSCGQFGLVSLVRERAWFKAAEDEQLSAGSRFLHGRPRRAVKAEAQNQPFQSDRGRHSTSLWNS